MPKRTPATDGSAKLDSGIEIRPLRRTRSSPIGDASPDTRSTISLSRAVSRQLHVSTASQMPSPSPSMPAQLAEQHMS